MMKNKTKPTLRIFLGFLFLAPLLGMVLPGCGESAEEQARAQEIAKKQAEEKEKALAAKKAEELAKKKAIKQATERMAEVLAQVKATDKNVALREIEEEYKPIQLKLEKEYEENTSKIRKRYETLEAEKIGKLKELIRLNSKSNLESAQSRYKAYEKEIVESRESIRKLDEKIPKLKTELEAKIRRLQEFPKELDKVESRFAYASGEIERLKVTNKDLEEGIKDIEDGKYLDERIKSMSFFQRKKFIKMQKELLEREKAELESLSREIEKIKESEEWKELRVRGIVEQEKRELERQIESLKKSRKGYCIDIERNESCLPKEKSEILRYTAEVSEINKLASEIKELAPLRDSELEKVRSKFNSERENVAKQQKASMRKSQEEYEKSRTKLLSEMEELAKSGKVDFNAKISYPAFKEKHSLKQILLLAKFANPPELENNPMGGLGKFLITAGLGVNLDLGLTSKQINTLLQAMWSANPKDLKAIVRNQVEQYYLKEGSCHECVGIEKVQDCGVGEYVGKALVRRISVKNGEISLGKVRAVDINIEVFDKMIQVEVIDFDI